MMEKLTRNSAGHICLRWLANIFIRNILILKYSVFIKTFPYHSKFVF